MPATPSVEGDSGGSQHRGAAWLRDERVDAAAGRPRLRRARDRDAADPGGPLQRARDEAGRARGDRFEIADSRAGPHRRGRARRRATAWPSSSPARDDQGTLAAANEVAGRLPRMWNMTGISMAGVEEQITRYLARRRRRRRPAARDLDRRRHRSPRARVGERAARPARRADDRIVRALADLDLAHRRGSQPQTLNFAETAAVSVELAGATGAATQAVVHRAGMNQRTLTPPIDPDELAPDSPGDRGAAAQAAPRAGEGVRFVESRTRSRAGTAIRYADLIPDRTDTTPDPRRTAGTRLGAAHIAARLGLETTGVTLPIANADREVRDATREPSPILVGRSNRLTQDLVKIGRARLDDLRARRGRRPDRAARVRQR